MVEKADFAVAPQRGMIQIDQEAISVQAISSDRPDTLDVSETECAKDNNESCLYGGTTGADWQVVGHDMWIGSDWWMIKRWMDPYECTSVLFVAGGSYFPRLIDSCTGS